VLSEIEFPQGAVSFYETGKLDVFGEKHGNKIF
jgi:hypothetical protein